MSALKKTGQPKPKTIVILRALQLGDMLNAVPALRALRAAYPHSHISLVGLPWAAEFVRRFAAYLDEFIPFPGFPGFPEQTPDIAALPAFLREMQARDFDLAIQMQGSGEISNPLMCLLGATQCAGFYRKGQFCPDEKYFLKYPENEPEARRHLKLMSFLGIRLRGAHLEFPIFPQDWECLEQLKERHHLAGQYVCIHPGARAAFRRWSTRKFAGVADRLAASGFQIVLTGTHEEAGLTQAVARDMRAPAIDLAGKTDLGSLAALVSQAHLVLSNDTGMSHMAAALKTPSVILFAGTESVRWAPQNKRLHKAVWQAMKKKTKEVLVQVESHLSDIYGSRIGENHAHLPYGFDLMKTGGRS